jgi:hypothetical protein
MPDEDLTGLSRWSWGEVGTQLEQCTRRLYVPARRCPEFVHDGDNVVNQIVDQTVYLTANC